MSYLGRKGAAAPINAIDIPDDSITSAKIVADAVGSSDLAPDIALTGGSLGIPSVTTANRPGEVGGTNASQTAAVGMLIYNTTLGMLQQYNAVGWASIDSPPTISSLNYPGDDTALDTVGEYNDATCDYNNDPTIAHDTNSNMKAGMSVSGTGIPVGATIASVTSTTAFELSASTTGGAVTNGTLTFNTQTLIITGTNFQTGVTVTIDGTAPSTVSRDSSTQITVTGTPAKTAGTKVDGLVVSNTSGLAASINIDYSPLPGWSSPASGNLGTLEINSSAISTIALTGGADTTSYTLTNTLPPGLVMDATDGDIDGTITGSVYQTYNFTVNAIDAQAQSSPRLFNIITIAPLPTGGAITTYTGFRVHTYIVGMSEAFTFIPTSTTTVDILMVAGGGGGGGRAGGGGGAGGFVYYSQKSLSAATYSIGVGGAGTAGASDATGGTGGDSTFTGLTTAAGGGGGAGDGASSAASGGSGGGGGYTGGSPDRSPGAGGTANQGKSGGDGANPYYMAGGGGASADGGNGGSAPHGGAGYTTGATVYNWTAGSGTVTFPANFTNGSSSTSYAGGGGGGGHSPFIARGLGGTGGGGDSGAINTHADGIAATANTGGGGGGACSSGGGSNVGGAGGTGIVIIRYAV